MARVPLLTADQASPASAKLLESIHRAMGATPAMFQAVANSSAALQSLWGSFGALSQGKLGAALGELIAMAVANRNRCDYCLAAHHALGRGAGVAADDLGLAQQGLSGDARTAVALRFALQLVDQRGQVTADDVNALRGAGFDDAEIVEVIAHVALNLFTNTVNIALDVPVDFPRIAPR